MKTKLEEIFNNAIIDIQNANALNDIDEINYKIGFYDENNSCLDVRFQNIASEIKPTFKRICVTYPIPSHTHSVKVGWEFKGIVTGVTIFHPSVDLY